MAKFSVTIREERCKGCGLCVHFCSYGVLRTKDKVNEHGYYSAEVADSSKCRGCTHCFLVCPDVSIKIEKN